MKRTVFILSAVAVLAVLCAGTLQAIPAFGRKYDMSCKTCHMPFPKLKPYGEEFMANGYVIKDKDAPRYTIDTGDSWLSLLRNFPVALRLDGFTTFNRSNAKRLDLASPAVVKLLSGGDIAKNISYYIYFMFTEMGEIAGLEDAFLTFNNIFGTGVALTVGQFQVSDPMFKRELRLSLEDYQVYTATPGRSLVNLTYDRGLMLNYGLPTGTNFTLEIVNGTGIGEAGDKGNYDFDKPKNLVFRVSQDLGEQLRVGGFGYVGWERLYGASNNLWMVGADASLNSAPVYLNLQYVERHDTDPDLRYAVKPEGVPSVATRGAFAELLFLPKADDSKWYALTLFNWVSSDQEDLKYLSLTGHAGYLLRRNIRATAETTYFFDSPYGSHVRFALGLVTGF